MQTSKPTPPSSLFSRTSAPTLLPRRTLSFLRSTNPLHLLSWSPPPPASDDAFNGWSYSAAAAPPPPTKRLTAGLIGGVSVGALLAAIAYFTVSGRGFRSSSFIGEDIVCSDENVEGVTEIASSTVPTEKPLRFKVSIPVDTSQLEALSVLNKLKIIEGDVRADELCTRREYARWLVLLNSLLERNPKHRIVPSVSLSGSVIAAFDDVGVGDPDFHSIQSLAEAGVVPSRLSWASSSSDNSEGDRSFFFYPDRFISRQDLIDWKAQLEHGSSLKGLTEQISKAKIDYMDVKEISSDASPELFIDMLAGDRSIIRKVFGTALFLVVLLMFKLRVVYACMNHL